MTNHPFHTRLAARAVMTFDTARLLITRPDLRRRVPARDWFRRV